ncbi:hypothetical protein [Streptomyces sp. AN091965]|uniref:hypothetical protein n=1 Tax=Streptomyces sp. AN091965 TaxID=2927803 RepID=UPI001F61BC40|nr:hypothetical protein [Streptomyces sp. AN091965]MCI3934441.1 hypothetical protein [Streptomyces sp. AN091965]
MPDKAAKPGTAKLPLIPASQVDPKELSVLSLLYRNGEPMLVMSGGTKIPAEIVVMNSTGVAVGSYTIGPSAAATKSAETKQIYYASPILGLETLHHSIASCHYLFKELGKSKGGTEESG